MPQTPMRTRPSPRARCLLLVLPLLCACEGAVDSGRAGGIAGTYAGAARSGGGTLAYRLTIPQTQAGSFSVTGTVTESGSTVEVRGTAVYEHPRVTFELVRAGEGAEGVFGLSGEVDGSWGAITVPGPGRALTLLRD